MPRKPPRGDQTIAPVSPEFNPTSLEKAGEMARHVLQLVTSRDGVVHSMGTATIVSPGLALTAAHILRACEKAYGWKTSSANAVEGDFMLYACQYVSESEVRRFVVDRFFAMGSTDLAIIRLRGEPGWLPTGYLKWTLLPPALGER